MVTLIKLDSSMPWWLFLLEGLALIVVGLLLVAAPGATTVLVIQVLGVYWLVKGVLSLVSIFTVRNGSWWVKLLLGVLGILAGLIVLQHPLWSSLLGVALLIMLLGVGAILMGVMGLIQAFQGAGWGAGFLGVLMIIVGLLLLGNQLIGMVFLPVALGLVALFGGGVVFVIAFVVRDQAKGDPPASGEEKPVPSIDRAATE